MNLLTVSVVIPSYRRPELLRRCLAALEAQTRAPDQTIVVLRDGDVASQVVADGDVWTALDVATVTESGVLAAMRTGVARSSGDVVVFTDDDAEPAEDWLQRLLALLSQPEVGAAGGRDIVPGQTEPQEKDVGRLRWYGKLVGNHHLGSGHARDVDVLKGVNMGYRAECLALPRPGLLRGDGAEVHFEVLCSRWAQRLGWRVVYDPEIVVGHAGAERAGLDRREQPAMEAIRDAAHNFVVATAGLDGARVLRQALYALAVGSKDAPGIVRVAVAVVRWEEAVIRRFPASFAGSLQGVTRLLRGLPERPMTTCSELRSELPRRQLV